VKKLLVLVLMGGLLFGLLGPAEAKKRKKKPPVVAAPVAIDQKFFLRRSACDSDPASTSLSLQDGEDVACWWQDAGVLYEAIETIFRPLVPEAADVVWQSFPAVDGLPLTLDTTKPVTGEMTVYSGTCIEDPVCGPVGLTAGQATLKVVLLGTTGGTETELGSFEESFLMTPGSTHTSKIEIALDPSLHQTALESFRLKVFHGGLSYGPGAIEYEDPASFLMMPSFVTPSLV
jgi:hypothetical protein